MEYDMILSKKKFTEEVELKISKGAEVIDAILGVCETYSLEPESAKRLMSDGLKDKLTAEASSLNLIKGSKSRGKLPI
jgi:hypothetical protein